ncbi:hypothetical protein [Nocardia abscessus]|uniref:hypothetical protein n=1 Tax=Nocardia abscessus TaxID=120957 RepID=UPI0024571CA9|nr:hypothetical protein [Nocardia abscessus]
MQLPRARGHTGRPENSNLLRDWRSRARHYDDRDDRDDRDERDERDERRDTVELIAVEFDVSFTIYRYLGK